MRVQIRTFARSACVALGAVAALSLSSCMTGGSKSEPGSSPARASKDGYKLRAFEERTLANGLRVLYIHDETLPYVTFSLLIRSGSAQDPRGQSGISAFVAEMLDKGTRRRSAPQIAAALGKLGAEFDASASVDYSSVSLSGLSMHASELAVNLVELVTQPAFSDVEIDRTRKNILAQLERRIDRPDSFADLVWEDFLFGPHPYAMPAFGRLPAVKGIKKKNLIQHYLRYYRPNNAILAVVGKFPPGLQSAIEGEFVKWQKRDVPAPQYPPVPPPKGIEIRIADKPGLVQAQVRMGHLGIKRTNEDFLALRLANTILGGAFASRLNDRIRKDLGLTYSIGSHFDARHDAGPFEISTFTKNETVGQAVSEIIKVVGDFRENGATREQVDRAKGYLKGIFPTAIETPERLAFNLLLLRLYGISDRYLTNYLEDIDDLSVSDVNKVIKKYIDEKNMKITVFADAKAVQAQLEPLGKVEIKKAVELQ